MATIMTDLYNIPSLGGFLYSWTVCLGHRFWILSLIRNHFSQKLRCWKSVISLSSSAVYWKFATRTCTWNLSVDISWKWFSSSELALGSLELALGSLELALGSLELALALGTCQQSVDISWEWVSSSELALGTCKPAWRSPQQWQSCSHLAAGREWKDLVVISHPGFSPKLARLPLTKPQVKATNFGLASRYWRSQDA